MRDALWIRVTLCYRVYAQVSNLVGTSPSADWRTKRALAGFAEDGLMTWQGTSGLCVGLPTQLTAPNARFLGGISQAFEHAGGVPNDVDVVVNRLDLALFIDNEGRPCWPHESDPKELLLAPRPVRRRDRPIGVA